MWRAGVALGSNLGDRLGLLQEATRRLRDLASPKEPFLAASIYQTPPWECPEGSPAFLNTVVDFACKLEPLELLARLRAIETKLGRTRDGVHHAPRLMDLDLLYHGGRIWSDDVLTLPHPRIAERRFVLQPLAEIRPDLVLPGAVFTIAEMLAMLPADEQQLEKLKVDEVSTMDRSRP